MFKHILCPTDLKERCYPALKKAIEFAHHFGSKITLLNCHPEFMNQDERQMLRVSSDELKEKFRKIAVDSRGKMQATMEKLQAGDIDIEYLLREGKPEKTIVDVAAACGIDLVIICTDGPDSIRDFIAGTITEHVINHVPCPVLVIPPP